MTLPNFLFIGPDKAGSTWLYAMLDAHPEVFLPPVKELFFFDRYYDRGLDWYASKFVGAGEAHRAVGEVCHDYLFSPEAAARIHTDIPDATLLTILRNPVQRTYSHWQYRVRSGATRADFETDLERCPQIVDQSCYARHLQVYFDLFPAEHIRWFSFAQLQSDPEGLAQQVCGALNISSLAAQAYDVRAQRNPAMTARNPGTVHVLRQVAKGLRAAGLERIVGAVKNNPVLTRTLFRPGPGTGSAAMKPETRDRLRDIFTPENARLEALLGCALPELWS